MHWLVLTTLISLTPLVSCAPSNEAFIPKLERDQKDLLSAIEENYLVSTSKVKEKSIPTSSPYILTSKLSTIDQNTSTSNVSIHETSQNQEATDKSDEEGGMLETSTVKEDQDVGEQIFSTLQTSHNQVGMDKPEKEFQLVEKSRPKYTKKDVEHTMSDQTITDYNISSNQTSQTESSEQRTKEDVTNEKEKPTKREDFIPLKGEDAEMVRQPQSETPSQLQTADLSTQQSPEKPEEASEKPTLSEESTVVSTTNPPTTKRPKPSKPKPPRTTTQSPAPVTASASVKPTSAVSQQRYPCRCADGTCSCCTGILLENFNVPLRSRACANVTYEPDDFAFNFKLAYNNIVLYNRRMSAKNPRPACIPINRYFGIKMCAKLSNVYMSGRNVHACLDFEGFFDDETAFKYSFNCFRIGSQGVAIVRPEDGGGLPPPPDEEEQTDEDYDDSARSWRSRRDKQFIP